MASLKGLGRGQVRRVSGDDGGLQLLGARVAVAVAALTMAARMEVFE
jgi:hypothetical protein